MSVYRAKVKTSTGKRYDFTYDTDTGEVKRKTGPDPVDLGELQTILGHSAGMTGTMDRYSITRWEVEKE